MKFNMKIVLLVLTVIMLLASFSFFIIKSSNKNVPPKAAEATEKPKEMDNEPVETAEPTPEPEIIELVEYENYTGEVPHIFTHCLIAYPEYKNSNGLMRYDIDCVNVKEFKRILKELYKNGYSLVNLEDTYEKEEDGELRLKESIEVPKGRKPFVLSVDDVVYDVKKRGNGMVDFLTLGENNEIITGTYEKDGSVRYEDDNEWIPILERFIEEYPDFSSHGARALICMTGFTGQFGYRTDRKYEGDRECEIVKAKQIADKLKEMGYHFASHSYGHSDVSKMSLSNLEKDLEHFKNEVVPVIGETSIFVYPYGKLLSPENEKYQLLQKYGFEVFCSVSHFFLQRDYEDGKSIYMTRVSLDGYSIRNYKTLLSPLMDTDAVLDKDNR